MPKYILNGKVYNIPDQLASKFESSNPKAKIMPLALPDDYASPAPWTKAQPRSAKRRTSPSGTSSPSATPSASVPSSTPVASPGTSSSGWVVPFDAAHPEAFGRRWNESPSVEPHAEEPNIARDTYRALLGDETSPEYDRVKKAGKRMREELEYSYETGEPLVKRKGFVETPWTAPVIARDAEGNILRDADGRPIIGETTDPDEVAIYNQEVLDAKRRDISRQLDEAYAERERLQGLLESRGNLLSSRAREEEESKPLWQRALEGFVHAEQPERFGDGLRLSDADYQNLQSAIRQNERRIASLEAERDDGGVLRGMSDTFSDPSFYSLGLTDMSDMSRLSSLKAKIDKAHSLGVKPEFSESEQALVQGVMNNDEAQRYMDNRGWGYNFGRGFAETLGFMGEFALSGGFGGVAQSGVRAGTKAGLKLAGSSLGKYLTKNIGSIPVKLLQSGLKGAGRLSGATAGGFLQSNTAGIAHTWSDIMEKNLGHLTTDKRGELTFEGGESLGRSILLGQLDAIGENASELIGPAFDFIPGYLGRVIRNKVGSGAIDRFLNNKWMRGGNKLLRYTGINGVFGEGMEEEANMLGSYIVGKVFDDDSHERHGLLDLRQQLDTWATVGLTGGLLRAPQSIASGFGEAVYYGHKYNLHFSDRRCSDLLGSDRWGIYRDELDNSSNKDIGSTLFRIINEPSLNREERQAVFTYANDLVRLRGHNLGSLCFASLSGEGGTPVGHERAASFNVRGNVIEEVNDLGEVIATHEYEDEESRKAGHYELLSRRMHQDMLGDIASLRTRSGGAYDSFVSDFCTTNGISVEDLNGMIERDPLEWSDGEQQLMTSFAKSLHSAVYDNSIIHTEESMRDGQSVSDAMSLDIESPDVSSADGVVNDWLSAQQAREELFSRNEALAQEVQTREDAGMSPQEIISSLDTFRPDDVQTLINYYNQRAKYEGFVARTKDNVVNAASNSRDRHTFKGTINGNPETTNLVMLVDSNGDSYHLVSGDVSVDSNGNIIDSGSGLLLAINSQGDIVSLSTNSSTTYTIQPSSVSLDEFEQQEQERIGMNLTDAIDGDGLLAPAVEPQGTGAEEVPQPTEQGVAEDAVVNSVTEGGEAPAAVPGTPAGEDAGTATQEIPTDKNGVKLYEEGTPIDAAIADIRNDGMDPVEFADLAISEAETALAKMKEPKTRADLVRNNARRKELQNVIDYYTQLKERYAEGSGATEATEATEAAGATDSGAPEWRYDTPEAARERGYKIVEGHRIDRQEEKPMPLGMVVEVQYSTKDKVMGRMTVSELGEVQGSHLVNGQRNEKNFIPEAQPKSEFGADRQAAAQSNASEANFRPELMLTFNGVQSAYSGSTTQTNRRGEVIQGNGRRNLAEYIYAPGNEAVAKRYKEFLMAHAAKLGTTAEDIAGMDKPFAHIVLDVTDAEAIRLGQFTAQDLETGGKKVPEVSSTVMKMGDRFVSFTGVLLRHEDPDASLAERIEGNLEEAVSWLNRGGYINNTEAKTLLEDKSAARQFLKDLLTDTLFSGASPDLRTMFYELPKNIQSAIVSVIGREVTTTDATSILKDIQESIQAYHELMVSSAQFAGVRGRNYEERKRASQSAVSDWLRQINIDSSLNQGKYSNFALELAMLYRSLSDQKTLATRLRDYYDLVNGATRQLGMFDDASSSGPLTREEAIKQIFGVEYGRQRTLPLAGDVQAGEGGQQGGPDRHQVGERGAVEGRPSESGRGDTGDAEVITTPESREDYLASHPLTESQIMADTEATEDEKLNAIDFLRGEDDSAISRFYYDGIYERAKKAEAEPQHTEKKPTPDPMEAIEKAANAFRDEQKSKDQQDIDDALKEFNDFLDGAKGSNVLDKFMRKGLEGNDKAQSNLLDAFTLTNEAQRMFLKDLLRLASKVGYAYIKSGVHEELAWSKKMFDSIGAKLKEVLGWEDAIISEFTGEVWNQKYTADGQRMRLREHAERLKNNKPADNSVNVNKTENNEAGNVVSSQSGAEEVPQRTGQLEGDSAEFAERQEKEKAFRSELKQELLHGVTGERTLKTMQDVKKVAEKHGLNMSMTDLQEIVEAVIVDMARGYANNPFLTDKQKFDNIVDLYETQPTLSARDNDRINKQQYSTPAPMAFLMGRFVMNGSHETSGPNGIRGLEPSAGNGMLTIALPKETMHVNDIDEMRLSNLAKQGFGEVTSQDGTQPFGEKKYDVVVTNPPFGSVPAKTYDGQYEISGLEHQMAINALESMKDDGRAAIIIGGNTEYNQNGTIKGKDRAFLNYLYAHYNVVDVINMDGKTLYSRQGTGFPVRMILINGRKEFNPRSYAPVIQKARAERVNSYDELYKRVNDDILSDSNKSAGVHDTESGESDGKHDNGHADTATQTGVRNVQPGGSGSEHNVLDTDGRGVRLPEQPTEAGGRGGRGLDSNGQADTGLVPGAPVRDSLRGTETTEPNRGAASQTESGGRGGRMASGGVDSERHTGGADLSSGGGSRGTGTAQPVQQPEPKRGLSTEKVPYKKQSSNPFTLDSLMPAEQADEVKKILEELGDVDQFLVDELGYSSKEELHQALAAEQIDSVAMAIHQMNQGNAFIIGDMTGIGKGRQAAALIRYGVKKGGCPVFITVKKGLFSDMYRDLCDIGSPGLRPFIWCAKDKEKSQDITDAEGNIVYKWNEKEQKRVREYILKNGKLPPEYDYIVTTYDGFKSGTIDYENGQKKARNFGAGKSAGSMAINGQAKRDALEVLARNSYVIMDESHNAGGDESNISKFLQYITAITKGTTFLSATFAKRPENMPIYALRTAISKAGVKVDELIAAVKKGGATFQEVMSKALTGAGQMIRRERDMTGVAIDWRGIEDEAVIEKQRQQYDTIIGLFNDIIDFQRRYVDPIVNKMNDEAADEQGEVDHTPGTRDMGINNTPFASRTYNMVQQVLLSLKAEEAAKRAIEHLKAGRKPVIALANTNEKSSEEASSSMEEDMEMPDLSVNLKKGLSGTLRITKKDAFGKAQNTEIPFERLSEEGRARYREIMDAIESASSGLSLSPIDVIKNELKKAGYKIGELTGRKAEFIYNEDGTVKRVKRQDTEKKKTAADFNSGKLDALIINRSAGTGISLHASEKFKDQRQRVMIVAQAQGDVNDEVQMRGRIDRTGQVLRGMYEYVVSQIPSEQRLLMMLKAKLRSLDANTTSSQKSKFNEMQVQDIINKYGDDIVIQYLAEHPDLAVKMVDPLKWTQKFGDGFESMGAETLASGIGIERGEAGSIASKVLGRMALLKVAEQEKMLQEIGDLYQAEIDRLNEMGENDLEITEMPLRAKTLKKDVWEEGVEPGGNNPFADNSYVEEVEMDVLRKPMKSEEVKKSQSRLLSSVAVVQPHTEHTWENYKQVVMEKLDAWEAEKKKDATDTITARAEKKAQAEKEKYAKGAKKAQDKNGMTDAEIEKNAQYQYDTFYHQEMEKLQSSLDGIEKQKQAFVDALETFTTDGVYALPTDIYDLGQLSFEPSFGKVIDIKITDNFSTAASTITFATLDGRRKITIPISGMVKQSNGEKRDIKPTIVQQTAQVRNGMFGSNIANTLKVLEQNVDNWDKLTSTATRKKGYIITGNLLKALTSLQKQHAGGKLISYTTDTGEIRQGVLMSDQFNPGTLTSQNPISSAKGELRYSGDKIESADGDVTIVAEGYGSWMSFTLRVPKSKKKGEKYFNDKVLLSLMDGQFEGSSNMRADFKKENLDAVLKRLDELGVTVQSKKEDNDMNSGYSEDLDDETYETDTTFSNQLDAYKDGEMKSSDTFSLGSPSPILRASGIKAKKLILTQSVLAKHLKKHGLSIDDIRDLPSALAQPMMVYEWGDKAKSHVIITDLTTNDGRKITVTLRVNSDNVVTEVSKITSVHGKDATRLISEMNTDKTDFGKDNLKYVDKEKALNWLAMDSPTESRQDNQELVSAAKIIKEFENPSISDEFNTNSDEMNQGYSEETDEEVIDRLEKEPKIKVYRAMQLIDGKLYPPMAAKQGGKLVNPIELGKWEKADEHPEMADENGKFKLDKGNGKSLKAAYNPYIHTSTTMLNDQFSEAQSRPNLVVVEVEVPESELTSGYKAEKAKDAVGRLEWKAGIIQGQLTGTREVILSRWDKPVRIVPTEEVAKSIAKQINGKVEVMPTNVVTPAQREALEKEGVKFVETDNRGKIVDGPNKGKTYSSVYGKKAKNSGYSDGEAKPQPTKHKENIRKHVERLLNKLGTRNRTTVITSINGVRNKARREHIESMHKQGKKVYGWFENGRIYLYLPDIDSIYKAEQTIWHETVAHVGLRELLGAENYGKLLNRLWMQHKDGEMGEWVTRRMQVNGWSLHKAIDEWLAREAEKVVAERQERRTLWQKLAGWVGDILREIGYRTNPTITDVRYLFWLSENQLRDGEPMSAIKRAAFLHRLERENRTAELQRPTKRGSDMDAGYSEDIDDPIGYSEKAVYDDRLNRVETVFTEAFQDSMIALKTAQNAIAHDDEILDSQNAYMAENLMHGRVKNAQDLFNTMFRDPLVATLNKIMNATGMNWGDIDRYVFTKHGLERNREFFVRDWLVKQRSKTIRSYDDLSPDAQYIYDRKAESIEELFEEGTIASEEEKEKALRKALQESHEEWLADIERGWQRTKRRASSIGGTYTFVDYLADLNHYIEQNIDEDYIPSEHDYSGFRAIYGDEKGQYDEDDIIDELMNTEDAIDSDDAMPHLTEQLWEQIRACTRYGLEYYREAGMRSDEEIDKVEQMFHWYVPMRGFKEKTGEDMYQYFSSKGKPSNTLEGLLKHAKGRGSEANFPIATIFSMTYKAISDCEQNLVNQHLYRLCQSHKNDLVVLSDSWLVLDDAGNWVEEYPEYADDMSNEELREATEAFEERMQSLQKEGKAKRVNGRAQLDYRPADPKKRDEHIVEVRINGRKRLMIVTGNPRMAQALNGQLRFERGNTFINRWYSRFKNLMSSLFTSYSPTFAARNMLRDWTHFRTMLSVREGEGYASAANGYYLEQLPKMMSLFRKYRSGQLDLNNEMERDFKEFMDEGGITGFVYMQKVDDVQKELDKLTRQMKDGKVIKFNNKVWEKSLGMVEAFNEAIENNARFATFRASRHYAHRTRSRSAYDAKEITVNFNRKGAGGKSMGFKSSSSAVEDAAKLFGATSQVLGEGRIFFNATIQAIATTFKNFQHPDGSLNGKYIARWALRYAFPPFMFGLLLPMINKMLFSLLGGDGDDDPYANLSEWTRRKNICIYIGGDNFLSIPISQEQSAFLMLGDLLAGMTYAPELKPIDKGFADEMLGFLTTFSPVDLDTKITKGGITGDPIDETIGRTFSVLAPIVAFEQNIGWTGRPIYREDVYANDEKKPEYQRVYSGTNPLLVEGSRLLHEWTGGDDVRRGAIEVNPGVVQYLWEQYSGGPGKLLSNSTSAGRDLRDWLRGEETEFNIRKIEVVKAFIQQGDDRTQYYRTLAKWRKYRSEAEDTEYELNGYKKKSKDDPLSNIRYDALRRGSDYTRMRIVKDADKVLKKMYHAADEATGSERKRLRRVYNEKVKETVDLLESVPDDE